MVDLKNVNGKRTLAQRRPYSTWLVAGSGGQRGHGSCRPLPGFPRAVESGSGVSECWAPPQGLAEWEHRLYAMEPCEERTQHFRGYLRDGPQATCTRVSVPSEHCVLCYERVIPGMPVTMVICV